MSLQFYDLMNVVITDLREVNILGDIQLRKCSYHSLENPSPFQNLKFEDTNTQISQVHLFPSGNIHYYFCCIISKYNIKINIHFLYIYIYSLLRCAQIYDVMYNFVCCADSECYISQIVRRCECRVWGSSALVYYSGRETDSCKFAVCRAYVAVEARRLVKPRFYH